MTRPAAFSLVELLIVLALVLVMMALMAPALRGARVAARETQCKAHLRAQAIALEAYRVDHRSRYPMACQSINFDGTGVYDQTAASVDERGYVWFLSIDPYLRCFSRISPAPVRDSSIDRNWDMGVMQCPEWASLERVPAENGGFLHPWTGLPLFGWNVPQYAYNQGFGFYDRHALANGIRLGSQVRNLNTPPSRAVVVVDALVPGNPSPWGFGWFVRNSRREPLVYWANSYTFRPAWVIDAGVWGGYTSVFGRNTGAGFRHVGGGANRLFADGHAASVRKTQADLTNLIKEFIIEPDVFPDPAGYP
jgi:prepilin-type processing-associated H-X9-DG protein